MRQTDRQTDTRTSTHTMFEGTQAGLGIGGNGSKVQNSWDLFSSISLCDLKSIEFPLPKFSNSNGSVLHMLPLEHVSCLFVAMEHVSCLFLSTLE